MHYPFFRGVAFLEDGLNRCRRADCSFFYLFLKWDGIGLTAVAGLPGFKTL